MSTRAFAVGITCVLGLQPLPQQEWAWPWMQLGSPRGEEVGAHDHQALHWGKGFWLTIEKTILFRKKGF